jgi:RNA polymerase sigma-70 factor, ECF subfamily
MSDFHLVLQEGIARLMRYAAALTRDADEAGELVQDTVREALANQRQCRGGANIRVWLFTILHDLRDNPFRQAIATSEPVCGREARLTLSQLDRALGQLPEEQRAIILLIGLERMTYAETAAILRMPVGTMRARLARGRAGLRRAMGIADAPREARAA